MTYVPGVNRITDDRLAKLPIYAQDEILLPGGKQ